MVRRKPECEKLRSQIGMLERESELFAKATRKAEDAARDYRDQFMEAKRQLDDVLTKLAESEREKGRLALDNQLLRDRLIDQDKLTDSLEKTTAELKRLQKLLNQRSGDEEPYGLSTPSSKQKHKKNSTEENRAKKGGAKKGHQGHGRKSFTPDEADHEVHLSDRELGDCECGSCDWCRQDPVERSVVRFVAAHTKKYLYYVPANKCEGCGKVVYGKVPEVMPRALYDNNTLAHMLAEFYFWGATAGSIERRFGINVGTFFAMAHRVGAAIKPLFDHIVANARHCQFIHADETSWANDGQNGYAWFFGNDSFRIFIFRQTRSSKVPLDILGDERLPIVLITDRYNGYSPLKVSRQYCYAHLLRDIKKEETTFPDDAEVITFAQDLKPLLTEACSLSKKSNSLGEYLKRATELRDEIMKVCWSEAKHEAVQYIQNIFRENEDKMFHWVTSPDIPPDNNFAERELRPTVIARKVSFGSQSEKGLMIRERIMTVMNTAHCRGRDPAEFIKEVLDLLAVDKNADITSMLEMDEKAARSG